MLKYFTESSSIFRDPVPGTKNTAFFYCNVIHIHKLLNKMDTTPQEEHGASAEKCFYFLPYIWKIKIRQLLELDV